MTILQLRVAMAAADLKSVSAAAKLLNISQPNASNSLKLLEEEVGFPVFVRTGSGLVLTGKGERLIALAGRIIDSNTKIMALQSEEEPYRLHLGTVDYYSAAEPFFDLCARHRDDPTADFRCSSVSISQGVQALAKRELDVVAVPVMKHQYAGLKRECSANKLEMVSLCHIPAMLIMRKDHPAALEGKCKNVSQGSDVMKDYPYVGLCNLAEDTSSTGFNDSDYIQCSQKIFVDDTNVRLRVIESTNGFYFGLPSIYKLMKLYELALFPVPGVSVELFCVSRQGDSERREIAEYTSMLKKAMLLMLSEL